MNFDLQQGLLLEDLLTLGGAALVVAIIVEALKRTFNWSAEFTKRFAPDVAIATGILLSVLVAIYLSRDVPQAALTGLLAGALAAGLYDVVAARIAKIFARLATIASALASSVGGKGTST